jgi:hypothetical protein
MDWKEKRKQMDKDIKAKIVPLLRDKGFKGSFPHFRRIHEKAIDVLSFQFSQWGPQFYVEIASAPATGVTLLDGTHFPPEIVKHNHCGDRTRIGNAPFDMEREDNQKIIEKIIKSLPEGEAWWKTQAPTHS